MKEPSDRNKSRPPRGAKDAVPREPGPEGSSTQELLTSAELLRRLSTTPPPSSKRTPKSPATPPPPPVGARSQATGAGVAPAPKPKVPSTPPRRSNWAEAQDSPPPLDASELKAIDRLTAWSLRRRLIVAGVATLGVLVLVTGLVIGLRGEERKPKVVVSVANAPPPELADAEEEEIESRPSKPRRKRPARKMTRRKLGARVSTVDAAVVRELELPSASGARVVDVEPDSAAAEAGLRVDDVVLAVDGKTVAYAGDLPRLVASAPIRRPVRIRVWRNKKKLVLKVSLGVPAAPRR